MPLSNTNNDDYESWHAIARLHFAHGRRSLLEDTHPMSCVRDMLQSVPGIQGYRNHLRPLSNQSKVQAGKSQPQSLESSLNPKAFEAIE